MGETLEFQPNYPDEEKQLISSTELKDLIERNNGFEASVHLRLEHNGEIAKTLGHWAKDEDVTTIESELMQDEVRHSPKASEKFGSFENAIDIKGDRRDGLYLEIRGPGRGPETFKNIKMKEVGDNTFCLTPDEEAFYDSLETGSLDDENGRGLYLCAQLAAQGGYDLDFYTKVTDGKAYHGYILRSKEDMKRAV